MTPAQSGAPDLFVVDRTPVRILLMLRRSVAGSRVSDANSSLRRAGVRCSTGHEVFDSASSTRPSRRRHRPSRRARTRRRAVVDRMMEGRAGQHNPSMSVTVTHAGAPRERAQRVVALARHEQLVTSTTYAVGSPRAALRRRNRRGHHALVEDGVDRGEVVAPALLRRQRGQGGA